MLKIPFIAALITSLLLAGWLVGWLWDDEDPIAPWEWRER